MRLYPPRVLRRCVYTRLEYYGVGVYSRLEFYGGASIPALSITEVRLYPPSIHTRITEVRLYPPRVFTEVRLYPPRVLRRCVYTRLEYYGGASIPA